MLTDPSRQDWKMPLARTQAGGNYGKFQLFPDRPIHLDFGAEPGGDGTAEKPINSFDTLFSDDGLECLCRSLCCNKITVKVRGVFKNSGLLDELAVEGRGRDYYGNLVIEAWDGFCTMQGRTVIEAAENTRIEAEIGFFENVSGIIFRNLAFNWRVSSQKPADSEGRSGIGLTGELYGFKGCSSLHFINCAFSQVVRIDFAAGEYDFPDPDPDYGGGGATGKKEETPIGRYPFPKPSGPKWPMGWGGGGGGGGWGSGGGGDGSGGGDGYIDASCNAFFSASNFRECSGIRLDDCRLDADIDLRSNAGARGWSFNLLGCQLSEVNGANAKAVAKIYDARSGKVTEDGEIESYSLVADSIVSGLANSSHFGLLACNFATEACATATPGNMPTNGKIGGQAKAESFAVLGTANLDCNGSSLASSASATHPSRWSYMADPCFRTVIDGGGNTLSEPYRQSSEGGDGVP